MVVTNGIERAIQYFHAIRDYLQESQDGQFCDTGRRVRLLCASRRVSYPVSDSKC